MQGTCGNQPLGGPSQHKPPIVSIDRRTGSTSLFADYRAIIEGAPSGAFSAITSFVEGNDGELYVTYGNATRIGRLAPQ